MYQQKQAPALSLLHTSHLLLRKPGVHHVHDTVDRERSLGHVRRHHHLAPGRTAGKLGPRGLPEDLLLRLRGQRRVQRIDV